MSRRSDPSDWMWAHAFDLMAQAERMQQQFFRLASPAPTQTVWEPPVDIIEDEREVVILVAMPGVPERNVRVTHEPGALVIRGERQVPFANARHAARQLEIPYGGFERRIPLSGVRIESGTHRMIDGCVVIHLQKQA